MSVPVTSKQNVVQVVFKRAWHDLEPKIIAGLLSGAIASTLIGLADVYGYPLDPTLAATITTGLTFLGGYIKSSTSRQTFDGNPNN